MLLQLLLLQNLYFLGIVHPCLYILFLLALPAELDRHWVIVIGFITGLIIDLFSHSLGVHTAACTFICFLRPYLIDRLVQEDERLVDTINSASLGWEAYIKYVSLMAVAHYTIVAFLEAFSFRHIGLTLLQIVLSALLTIALILGYELTRHD